jgi:hypothetical protein
VAAFRPAIDATVRGTGIDPALLEAIVFVESAGRPDVIAGGSDPAGAAGLTQILAQTGQALLGMRIDLAASRRLTAAISRANDQGDVAAIQRLERQRAKADDRFAPRKALAATVRYLEQARQRFHRTDLAVVSYHMGIGNLAQVLADYNGGGDVPYAQLYFDSSPDRHPAAWRLLSSFGDDSSLYYWRVLGALQIMRLYRADHAALTRLASLQEGSDSSADVLHPPDRTPSFADPDALFAAYASRQLVALPSNRAALGLAYDSSMGSIAAQVGAPAVLYRGLRPAALDLLIELAVRVRAISHVRARLTVVSTVMDQRYQSQLAVADPEATTGYSFSLGRRYASRAQALALQAMLDRLQALDLVAWVRTPTTINVTVASDASRVIADGV